MKKLRLLHLLILCVLFFIFLGFSYFNVLLKKENAFLGIYQNPIQFSPGVYPVASGFAPEISAEGAVVIDKNSMVTLYRKNPNFRLPPASTTKIMTALVALDYYNPEDVLTIFERDPEGVNLGFYISEKFTFENLIYAMMLPSSNDATLAISQNFPGGESAFVEKMNEKAKELSLSNTYFEEPVGLLDEKDYSNPIDLARLTAIALNNSEFAKIVSTKEKIITNLEGKEYRLESLNILLDLPGISGVKTGYTEGAGQVLVTSKKLENGQELILVVMQSQDRFGDTQILLNYLSKINYLSIQP